MTSDLPLFYEPLKTIVEARGYKLAPLDWYSPHEVVSIQDITDIQGKRYYFDALERVAHMSTEQVYARLNNIDRVIPHSPLVRRMQEFVCSQKKAVHHAVVTLSSIEERPVDDVLKSLQIDRVWWCRGTVDKEPFMVAVAARKDGSFLMV